MQFSYFKVIVNDTIKNPLKDVLKQLKEYASIIRENFKTGDKSSYYVTYEKDVTLSANDPNYPILSKLKPGEHIVLSNGSSSVVIYELGSKTAEIVSSYDKVKEQCIGYVTNIKREKAEQEFVSQAQKKYPVVLESPLFK